MRGRGGGGGAPCNRWFCQHAAESRVPCLALVLPVLMCCLVSYYYRITQVCVVVSLCRETRRKRCPHFSYWPTFFFFFVEMKISLANCIDVSVRLYYHDSKTIWPRFLLCISCRNGCVFSSIFCFCVSTQREKSTSGRETKVTKTGSVGCLFARIWYLAEGESFVTSLIPRGGRCSFFFLVLGFFVCA